MQRGQGQRDSCKSAYSKIFVMNEKDPSGRECTVCEQNVWATGVKILAIPYKKDKALCSPTSALERNE